MQIVRAFSLSLHCLHGKMLCRLRASTAAVSKARMATLVATEEFPIKASLSPKATTAAVIKSNTVEGGLQVITRDCTSSFVSLKFAVAGGSSAETASTRGSANLLATAAFAGNTNRSGMELVHHLESVGASFHAYADKEKIVYDVKVLADQAESAIAAVVNAIALPPRAGYVLDELKDVAQLEYNKFAANPSAQLRELVQEAAFGEGSPLGASRFTGSLKKLSAAQALEFRSAQFVRGNVVIAANGISQERLGAVLGKTVDEIPAGAAWNTSALPFVGSDVKVRADLDGVSRVGLAFPVPAGEAGKPYAVLNALLAAKLSSQKQCASSFLDTFRQNSLFGVEMAGQASGVAQQLEAVVAELKNIAAQCPSIDAVKQKLTLEYFLALEGTCSTEKLLCAHLRGLNAQSVGDLRSVTPASVSAAAAASLKANPAYAVLGATAGTPSYAAVVNMLK